MVPERGQESVHVIVDMRETCVMSVLTCILKSKMKIQNQNVQVSLQHISIEFASHYVEH